MNKSERLVLANMVSEMTTSIESTPEVITWGEKLLAAFPCISKQVQQTNEVQLIENAAKSYMRYVVEMSTSYSGIAKNDSHIFHLGFDGLKNLYHVFDSYLRLDHAIDSVELEDVLTGEPTKARTMIRTLIADPAFIAEIDAIDELTAEQKELYKGQCFRL